MFGPLLTRELLSVPRRPRHFLARGLYLGVFFLLVTTAWLVVSGSQSVQTLGSLARFGQIIFPLLVPLQLALALFFSALLTASAIGQEKARGTFDLLLMTSLTNRELVLGRLGASLLNIFVLWVSTLPLFAALVLLGGVSLTQVARVAGLTLAAAIAAGSIGSTIALWREKTFQSLALTALALVAWIAVGEVVARGSFATSLAGYPPEAVAAMVSPLRAVLTSSQAPDAVAISRNFLVATIVIVVALNGLAMWRIRKWNPTQEARGATEVESFTAGDRASVQQAHVHQAPGQVRTVWDNPVLWREVCTWAYGRRILLIRLAYYALCGLGFWAAYSIVNSDPPRQNAGLAMLLPPLFVLSLILLNAVAITSLTTERDGRTLDLLLVTDLSPKEFIYGKLGGILYVAKEMWLLPIGLCVYLAVAGAISWENAIYLVGGLLVMDVFVAVLGIHAGMSYDNSRTGIGVSLGTVFFLFLGIATCMRLMVAFSGDFQLQLAPFLIFTLGGGLGLFFVLGVRNQSSAILVASMLCPLATFWAITSFLQNYTLGVFLVASAAYGFVTIALLIPAIYEFDVATGRTTSAAE